MTKVLPKAFVNPEPS